MKRLLSVLLAMCLLFSLAVTAFAADGSNPDIYFVKPTDSGSTYTFENLPEHYSPEYVAVKQSTYVIVLVDPAIPLTAAYQATVKQEILDKTPGKSEDKATFLFHSGFSADLTAPKQLVGVLALEQAGGLWTLTYNSRAWSHVSLAKFVFVPPTEPEPEGETVAVTLNKAVLDARGNQVDLDQLAETLKGLKKAAPVFTFGVTVDGDPWDDVVLDQDNGWSAVLDEIAKGATVVITEKAVTGYAAVKGSVVLEALEQDASVDFENRLVYSGSDSAAAFSPLKQYAAIGGAWHKVSIDQGEFNIYAGQDTLVGTGSAYGEAPVYTLFPGVVETEDYKWAYGTDASTLASLSPGHLSGATVGNYVRVHFSVSVPAIYK